MDADTAGTLLTVGLFLLAALVALIANRGAAENLTDAFTDKERIR